MSKFKHFHDQDEASKAAADVLAYAAQRGLYGVMILSPICEGCRTLHDWRLIACPTPGMEADLPREKIDSMIADLLQHHADAIRSGESEGGLVPIPGGGRKH